MPTPAELSKKYQAKSYMVYQLPIMLDDNIQVKPAVKVEMYVYSDSKELGAEVMQTNLPPNIITALNNFLSQATANFEDQSGLTKRVRR